MTAIAGTSINHNFAWSKSTFRLTHRLYNIRLQSSLTDRRFVLSYIDHNSRLQPLHEYRPYLSSIEANHTFVLTTDHRLGEPLPHQPPNRNAAHLKARWNHSRSPTLYRAHTLMQKLYPVARALLPHFQVNHCTSTLPYAVDALKHPLNSHV